MAGEGRAPTAKMSGGTNKSLLRRSTHRRCTRCSTGRVRAGRNRRRNPRDNQNGS